MKIIRMLSTVLLAIGLLGCETMYFKTMENFGYHKRDILVERVEEAKESQEEAKDQFVSALDAFKAATNFDGGDLEKVYRQLDGVYQDSVDKAETVREDIDNVESVATALFSEWKQELALYSDDTLRAQSQKTYRGAKARYEELIAAMRRAEKKIDPVLIPLHDQVLFLKHNLNAKAIQSLSKSVLKVEVDVSALIRDMEAAIEEADEFIASME